MPHLRLTLKLALGLCLAHCAWSLPGASSPAAEPPAATDQVAALSKPLDDPANPYHKLYTATDAWVQAHLGQPGWDITGGAVPGDFQTIEAFIDAEGWLVPQCVARKNLEDSIKLRTEDVSRAYPVATTASGYMPAELYQAWQQELWNISAEYYKAVPEWLVQDPPVMALLLPNGEVITLGDLGSAATISLEQLSTLSENGARPPFYRYSAGGKLLGTSDAFWWDLYLAPGSPAAAAQRIKQRNDGYFYDLDGRGEIKAIYDYDGSVLPSTAEPAARDYHAFTLLSAAQLRLLYNAQHPVAR
jgi:hypothetical protein